MACGLRCDLFLDADAAHELRRAMSFEAGKFDPQHAEGSALAPYALILGAGEWETLARRAEAIAAELRAAEDALLAERWLWKQLAMPRSFRRGLRAARGDGGPAAPSPGGPRVIRFDFHPTTNGWKLSEANTDVPGGFLEAAWLPRLLLGMHGDASFTAPADPGEMLVEAIVERLRAIDDGSRDEPHDEPHDEPRGEPRGSAAREGAGRVVALLHATAFVDDRQVMAHLGRIAGRHGLRPVLAAPDQIRDEVGGVDGRRGLTRLRLDTEWYQGPLDAIIRFYPGEWLGVLPRGTGWPALAQPSSTLQSNPPSSLLVQSKRLPLLVERGGFRAARSMDPLPPMPHFLAALPRSVDPRSARRDELGKWIVKPALGRVGDGVLVAGVTPADETKAILRAVRRDPDAYALQERFESIPIETPEGPRHACLGIFTVDGRCAGVYGRVARRARIDGGAQDVAVLLRG